MKIQTVGPECPASEQERLVLPPAGRRRRRPLIGNCQAALQAFTILISVVSLTMSSIIFMVLVYTPASGPLGQARDVADLREVVDMQRQVIGHLQREDNYQDARQKALQSALAAAGLLTDDVIAQLEGIERALMAKEQEEVPGDIADLVSLGAETEGSSRIGRPDGHEKLRPGMPGHSESEEESYEDIIA